MKKSNLSNIVIMGRTCSGKGTFAKKFLNYHIVIDFRAIGSEIFKGKKNKSYSWRIFKYLVSCIGEKCHLAVIAGNSLRQHRLKLLEIMGGNTELYNIRRDPIECMNESGSGIEVVHEPSNTEGFKNIVEVENCNYKYKFNLNEERSMLGGQDSCR